MNRYYCYEDKYGGFWKKFVDEDIVRKYENLSITGVWDFGKGLTKVPEIYVVRKLEELTK